MVYCVQSYISGVILFLITIQTSFSLVHVTNPSVVSKYYQDAPLNLYPRKFNVTGQFALADPVGACEKITNPQDVEGKIVFVKQGTYFVAYLSLKYRLKL